jgi:hypothetical protein
VITVVGVPDAGMAGMKEQCLHQEMHALTGNKSQDRV